MSSSVSERGEQLYPAAEVAECSSIMLETFEEQSELVGGGVNKLKNCKNQRLSSWIWARNTVATANLFVELILYFIST